mgnify:CR=1 FL=1|jgi:hypothetical protein|tara:strand:- start:2045 stop:2200 length:156 start_codon:yes stop_codon:yes gene_type:complete
MKIKRVTPVSKARNYIAKSLYNPFFRQKKVENKKKYRRKGKENVYACSIQD